MDESPERSRENTEAVTIEPQRPSRNNRAVAIERYTPGDEDTTSIALITAADPGVGKVAYIYAA